MIEPCRFKIGDKIICTDKNHTELIYNEVYIVSEIEGFEQGYEEYFINGYYAWRFERLTEIRKIKLKKLQEL